MVDHLFRYESGKMVAALTKLFGFDQLEVAEDIVQDTFIQAFETWKYNGTPNNPQAWLYKVAKNKATDYCRRLQTKRKVDDHIKTAIPIQYSLTAEIEKVFHDIEDSQLRLLFSICHPSIPVEAQIALALKTLSGFGIQEIANAFLTSKETINKRLFRAKEKIRKENIDLEIPSKSHLPKRLEIVLKVIYLMFNEGYYSSTQETVVRKDLCLEAMRLCLLLIQSELRGKDIFALMALMCFHSSRFESRLTDDGDLITWDFQDRSSWNKELIGQGEFYLRKMEPEDISTKYQIEAAIAYHHIYPDSPTKWEALLGLYSRLAKVSNNPIVLLNLGYVLFRVHGSERAMKFLDSIDSLESHYLLFALKGEILTQDNPVIAIEMFLKSIEKTSLEVEKKALKEKIRKINERTSNN